MLSYRHSFHAGNFADVLKHIVQALIIEALKQKPKPFVYYDTHAGAGRYDLMDAKSQKTAEFKNGIEKLWNNTELPDLLTPYMDVIKQLNPKGELYYYPGSPLLTHLLVPRNYRLELSELHPTDVLLLQQEFQNKRSVSITQKDGFKTLIAKLPPIQRRGLILIDPPYELKTESDDVVRAIKVAYNKFSTGIYAIWYPLVSRQQIESFCTKFKHSGIKNIIRIELCVKADSEGYGMTGTGMIIINPPWKLAEQMHKLMPWLIENLKQDDSPFYKIETISSE